MFFHITVDELEEEFQKPWKLSLIHNLSIDFATNAIHGIFEEKEVIVFNFRDYGFITDNRKSSYSISSGPAGLTVHIFLPNKKATS